MNDANIPPADPVNIDMPAIVTSDNASGSGEPYSIQKSNTANAIMIIMPDIRVKDTITYVIIFMLSLLFHSSVCP